MTGKLTRGIDRSVEFALFLIFLAFTIVGGLQVFNRFVLGLPLSWSEEFQKFGHIWMVFLAIPVAYRRGAHIGMDMVFFLLPARAQRGISIVVELMWLAMAVAIGWFTTAIMEVARFQESPGLGWRMDWVYSGLVVGAVYLAFVAVRRLAAQFGFNDGSVPPPAGGHGCWSAFSSCCWS